ncbi:MAG: phosphate uptake regulator PhoU, partial [Nanoarchaeota archaeon]|nr:phosphate uptake regulator PhoU [Nanoarchaeota archaeon]
MDIRKIIEFGKSSYVISLPKNWVQAKKLKKGDIVYLTENEETLVIMPKEAKEQKREKKSIKIDVSNMSLKRIRNHIISRYIQNYNEIILQGNNIKDHLAEIRETIHNLVALEIMEENYNKITTHDFLNMREISINNLIRKMDIITKAMISDSKKAKNEDVYDNISIRDQDVNKMSYLIFRAINHLHHDTALAKEQEMTSDKLLKAWIVTSSIERVGDQVKRISKLMRRVKKLDEKGWDGLLGLYNKIENMYVDALKAYYTNSEELAYDISIRKSDLLNECRSYYGKYWMVEWIPTIIEKFKFMIGFVQPISKTVLN